MATSPKRLPNPQAVQHLKDKSLLPAFSYDDVLAYEHAIAFTVAKMMNADLLADTQQALTQALENGTPFSEFKKQMKPYLMAKGWWGEKIQTDPKDGQSKKVQLGSNRRLKIIYETNLSTAYAAGRWQKIQSNKGLLPYLQYMPSVSKDKRDEHKGYYGLVRPVDDPIWASIFPPNGFGCKCWTKSLTQKEAQAILKTQNEQGRRFDLPIITEHNPRRGVDVKTVQGTQGSFASNHDRLTALIKVAEGKHGVDFAKQLADNVVTMDTIAERFLKDWIGKKKDNYVKLFTGDLAEIASKHKLSESEFMALRHYTEANVTIGYRELNALLNQKDTIDWGRYLSLVSAQHIIDQALQKMPVFTGVVKRTLHLPPKVLEQYQVGQVLEFRGLTSSTYGEAIEIDKNSNVVLTIKSKQGRLIEDISRFKREKEVLFGSFSKFKVEEADYKNNTYYFKLTEIEE